MSPKIKLTYFNGRGRGEVIRLMLKAAKLDFENVRVTSEEWATAKPSIAPPFGQLPLLEYDGVKMAQTLAILRFLAITHGMAGSNPHENWQLDAIADSIQDCVVALFNTMYTAGNAEKFKEAADGAFTKLANFLKGFETIVASNGGPFFLGNKMTWVDILFFDMINAMTDLDNPMYKKFMPQLDQEKRKNVMKDFTNLQNLCSAVENNTEIKNWLATRPSNDQETF